MQSFGHILANVQNSTPPEKHRRVRSGKGEALSVSELSALERLGLSLEGIVEACKERRDADPHKVIAYALSDEARVNREETGMTLREQARLSFDLINKAEPSKKALDIDANIKGTVQIGIISFADIDPASMETEAVSTSNVAGS